MYAIRSYYEPVDTQLMYLSQTVGESCFRVAMFTTPIAIVLVFVYPILPPASPALGMLFLLSCVLALLILAMINFLVGSMALHIYSIVITSYSIHYTKLYDPGIIDSRISHLPC